MTKTSNFFLSICVLSFASLDNLHAGYREQTILKDPAGQTVKQSNNRLSNDTQVLSLLIKTRNDKYVLALLSNRPKGNLNTFVSSECDYADYEMTPNAALLHCTLKSSRRKISYTHTYEITFEPQENLQIETKLRQTHSRIAPDTSSDVY